MALAIATNNAALNAAAAASSVNRDMETSMARLSTGKRINSASDDAAGVAIASRLTSEIRGTDQAIRNAVDGQALIDTAEGGHNEIENILQRMREVSVQAANDTNDANDRSNLQAEMTALITEIDRIASVTTWAGQSLMGSSGSSFSFQVGTATGDKNQIKVSLAAMGKAALGLSGGDTAKEVAALADAAGVSLDTTTGIMTLDGSAPNYTSDIVGKTIASASNGTASSTAIVGSGTAGSAGVLGAVTVTSAADDSGITFTIAGTNSAGASINEVLTGANAGAATTTATFKTVTSVTLSGNASGAVVIGDGTDIDSILRNGTHTAGAQTLDGADVQGSVNVFYEAIVGSGAAGSSGTVGALTVTSAADDSGITFTIVGTDSAGASKTEVLTGANAGAATTTATFKTVTSVTLSGNAAGSVVIGDGTDIDSILKMSTPTSGAQTLNGVDVHFSNTKANRDATAAQFAAAINAGSVRGVKAVTLADVAVVGSTRSGGAGTAAALVFSGSSSTVGASWEVKGTDANGKAISETIAGDALQQKLSDVSVNATTLAAEKNGLTSSGVFTFDTTGQLNILGKMSFAIDTDGNGVAEDFTFASTTVINSVARKVGMLGNHSTEGLVNGARSDGTFTIATAAQTNTVARMNFKIDATGLGDEDFSFSSDTKISSRGGAASGLGDHTSTAMANGARTAKDFTVASSSANSAVSTMDFAIDTDGNGVKENYSFSSNTKISKRGGEASRLAAGVAEVNGTTKVDGSTSAGVFTIAPTGQTDAKAKMTFKLDTDGSGTADAYAFESNSKIVHDWGSSTNIAANGAGTNMTALASNAFTFATSGQTAAVATIKFKIDANGNGTKNDFSFSSTTALTTTGADATNANKKILADEIAAKINSDSSMTTAGIAAQTDSTGKITLTFNNVAGSSASTANKKTVGDEIAVKINADTTLTKAGVGATVDANGTVSLTFTAGQEAGASHTSGAPAKALRVTAGNEIAAKINADAILTEAGIGASADADGKVTLTFTTDQTAGSSATTANKKAVGDEIAAKINSDAKLTEAGITATADANGTVTLAFGKTDGSAAQTHNKKTVGDEIAAKINAKTEMQTAGIGATVDANGTVTLTYGTAANEPATSTSSKSFLTVESITQTGDFTGTVSIGTAANIHGIVSDTDTAAGLIEMGKSRENIMVNARVEIWHGADDMTDATKAMHAVSVIDEALKLVNTQRSELGAVSNRLSHTVSNLTNISANLSAAKGGIEDADFAFETTQLAKNQILQQASTAMLAQANASKQNVLSLLQG